MRRLFNYENRNEPVASRTVFYNRVTRSALWSLAMVLLSLLIGTAGYIYFEGMRLVDAFVNAAMILSSMGPLMPLVTDGGKIFAALYAIISGFLLIGLAGLMLAPIFHRVLHRFHVDEGDDDTPPAPRQKPQRRKRSR